MKKYTPEIAAFIKKHYKKAANNNELRCMVNARFEKGFTEDAILQFAHRNGLKRRNIIYPIGSERVNRRGYTMVKIAMHGPNDTLWKEKHKLVWEKAHGIIPKGCVIIFLDGNKSNFSLKNLAMLTRAEVVKLNQFGFCSNDRDITLAGIAVVKHLLAVHGRLEKMLGPKKHKLFINKASEKKKKSGRRVLV
jgi:hypothetical protein